MKPKRAKFHQEVAAPLLDFIDRSPTFFYNVKAMKKHFWTKGFRVLDEACSWKLKAGEKYMVLRNDSFLIVFKVGSDSPEVSFKIIGIHTDSSLGVKAESDLSKSWIRVIGSRDLRLGSFDDLEGSGLIFDGLCNFT